MTDQRGSTKVNYVMLDAPLSLQVPRIHLKSETMEHTEQLEDTPSALKPQQLLSIDTSCVRKQSLRDIKTEQIQKIRQINKAIQIPYPRPGSGDGTPLASQVPPSETRRNTLLIQAELSTNSQNGNYGYQDNQTPVRIQIDGCPMNRTNQDNLLQTTMKKTVKSVSHSVVPLMLVSSLAHATILLVSLDVFPLPTDIRIAGYLLFCLLIVLTVAITRVLMMVFKTNLISLYSFVWVFPVLVWFASHTTQGLFLTTWPAAHVSNCIQVGQVQLQKHLSVMMFLIFGSYIIIQIVKSSYTETCDVAPCHLAGYDAIIITISFLLNSMALIIDRQSHIALGQYVEEDLKMQSLVMTNLDLQGRLRVALIKEDTDDITAPITKAKQTLMGLLEEEATNDETLKWDLEVILELLDSDKLFEPSFIDKIGDEELSQFLRNYLDNDEHNAKVEPGVLGTAPHLGKTNPSDQNKLIDVLDNMHLPFFDVIELEVMSEGHSLFYVGTTLYLQHDFQESLGINERQFRHWLSKIEKGYDHSNPYHNSMHAADVLHTLHYFVMSDKIREFLTMEDILACIIAGAGHDYMHPGFTNSFLIASRNPLALRYNDQSVLEHFHAASMSEILLQPEFDILSNLSVEKCKYIREMATSMILATDLAFHFESIGKFQNKMNSFNFENKNDKKMVLNMAIKCADVNNLAKPLGLSRKWTQMIMDEFFRQGDKEKDRGMPISMFMDRTNTDIPKCQIVGFIEYIVLPQFEVWSAFLPGYIDGHIENIKENRTYWKSFAEHGRTPERINMPVIEVMPLRKILRNVRTDSEDDQDTPHRMSRATTSGSVTGVRPQLDALPRSSTTTKPPTLRSRPARAPLGKIAVKSFKGNRNLQLEEADTKSLDFLVPKPTFYHTLRSPVSPRPKAGSPSRLGRAATLDSSSSDQGSNPIVYQESHGSSSISSDQIHSGSNVDHQMKCPKSLSGLRVSTLPDTCPDPPIDADVMLPGLATNILDATISVQVEDKPSSIDLIESP